MAHAIILSDVVEGRDVGYSRYIAPYLLATKAREEGFDCLVIDKFTRLQNLKEVLKKHIGPETVFIGISSTFLAAKVENPSDHTNLRPTLWLKNKNDFIQWMRELRQLTQNQKSEAKIVCGGAKSLYSMEHEETAELFDFFILGKAESYFASLLQLLVQGKEIPIKQHKNTFYTCDLFFPNARVEHVSNTVWNKKDFVLKGESLPIELTKGCLYNCKFCNFEKQGSLRKELSRLRDEFIRNYELFGTTVYHFCDDCFNDTRPKVEEFCNMFLSLPFKIEWISYARVDVACKFPHTLDLMVESGARALFWGLESFDPVAARNSGKGTHPDRVKEMLISSKRKHGDKVLYFAGFIIGLPGEDESNLEKTVDWIKNSGALDQFVLFPLSLIPYSEKLDKALIDFAEYSRNPTKYGFEKVTFKPNYWKHKLMNSDRAAELASHYTKIIKEFGVGRSVITSAFQYPHLRTLGFTHNEIVKALKEGSYGSSFHKIVLTRQEEYYDQYGKALNECHLD